MRWPGPRTVTEVRANNILRVGAFLARTFENKSAYFVEDPHGDRDFEKRM